MVPVERLEQPVVVHERAQSGAQLELFEFTVDWGTDTASFDGPTLLPTANFDPWICGINKTFCVPQKGTRTQLDALNEEVVTAACERLGLRADEHPRARTWSIDFGNEALVDTLPGVGGGASFLGTFDREAAVADESLDFFAAGHPMVEGLLMHIDDSALGRVALLRVSLGDASGLTQALLGGWRLSAINYMWAGEPVTFAYTSAPGDPRVGFVAQDHPLYKSFSIADTLTFGRKLNPRWDNDLAQRRLLRLGIPLNRAVGKLSGGQQAQLALALH